MFPIHQFFDCTIHYYYFMVLREQNFDMSNHFQVIGTHLAGCSEACGAKAKTHRNVALMRKKCQRQDIKTEQHHPIHNICCRQTMKLKWLKLQFTQQKEFAEYFSMLSQRDTMTESSLSINLCSLFLSLFACRHFAEFTVFGRGQKDKRASLLSLSPGRTQAQVLA